MRAFGIYAYRISDPRVFYEKVSGTRASYTGPELEGQLRNTIVGRITDMCGSAEVNFLDKAAHQQQLGQGMVGAMRPVFADLGLLLENFTVENISLPEELQKLLDQRIGMNMIGDMNRYTQRNRCRSPPPTRAGHCPARVSVWAPA